MHRLVHGRTHTRPHRPAVLPLTWSSPSMAARSPSAPKYPFWKPSALVVGTMTTCGCSGDAARSSRVLSSCCEYVGGGSGLLMVVVVDVVGAVGLCMLVSEAARLRTTLTPARSGCDMVSDQPSAVGAATHTRRGRKRAASSRIQRSNYIIIRIWTHGHGGVDVHLRRCLQETDSSDARHTSGACPLQGALWLWAKI